MTTYFRSRSLTIPSFSCKINFILCFSLKASSVLW